MNDPVVSLVVVVHGAIYERYAAKMLRSAAVHFDPSPLVELVTVPGEPGWPNASSCRYRRILEHADQVAGDYVFMVDADMLFEDRVGQEILTPEGLTVTIHPGFPDPGQADAPWNQDIDERSAAWCVDVPRAGVRYHPGAFVGGPRGVFLELARTVEEWLEQDGAAGFWPRWYDESYLNRYLLEHPPALVLDGSYCAWDYLGDKVPRRIVHQDKTADEMRLRGLEEDAA